MKTQHNQKGEILTAGFAALFVVQFLLGTAAVIGGAFLVGHESGTASQCTTDTNCEQQK